VQLYGELHGHGINKRTYTGPRGWDEHWHADGPKQYFLAFDVKYKKRGGGGTDTFMQPREFVQLARDFETQHPDVPVQVFMPAEGVVEEDMSSVDDVHRIVRTLSQRSSAKPAMEGVVFKRDGCGIESYFKYVDSTQSANLPAGAVDALDAEQLLDMITEEACLKRAADQYYAVAQWPLFFKRVYEDVIADAVTLGHTNAPRLKSCLTDRARAKVRQLFPPSRFSN
jgi:hypothetical protein